MILCRGCRRIWPKGTRYCGICRATLGARYCPADHASPLVAGCCLTCGSPKLTKGVPCANLRPITWIASAGLTLLVGVSIASTAARSLTSATSCAVERLFPTALAAGLLGLALRKLIGESAFNAITGLGFDLLKVLLAAAKAMLKVGGKGKSA